MDFFEFYSWSEKWFMDNFQPLPLVNYVSPCYNPYEMDPSHYDNNYQPPFNNSNDADYYYNCQDEYHYDTMEYSESESDSDFDTV